MRKILTLLLVVIALGVMSGVASAANGTIWPDMKACSVGQRVR